MRGGRRIKVSNARAGALPQTASGNFTEMWKTYRGRGSRRAAPALTNRTRARTPRPRTCRGLRSHFHILMYLSRSSRRRARSPARLGGLTADARYLPHLSPPPTRNRMALQNKTVNKGRATNVRHRSHSRRVEGLLHSGTLTDYTTPDSRAENRWFTPDGLRSWPPT